MLSILIPTYDYTCYKLVLDLHEQAERLGIPYEIIVAEDGSRAQVNVIANHKITELSNCKHLVRKENVGRSAIRNVLIEESQGDWLLFMDADGKVVREDFLHKYWEASKEHEVVCGGIKTPDSCPNPQKRLRWMYEKDYEEKHGYVSEQFRSFCFLIKREVAERIRFDERYRHYGFEDVQFGIDLQDAGIQVVGIDNPLENQDLEDNAVFLKKTEEAIRTAYEFRQDIGQHITLSRLYQKYQMWGWVMRLFFQLFHAPMQRQLTSDKPSLFWFSVYKLCYYAHLS